MYLYCGYPAISTSHSHKNAEMGVILNHFYWRPLSPPCVYCYRFLQFFLYKNQVPEKLGLVHDTEVYLIPFISTQIHTIIGWSPDSIHVLGQRWLSVSNIVGPTLANDVDPIQFCPSALGWPNKLGLCWPNDFRQQCLQFANKVPTNFGRKLWWANDGPSMT
jgi:hypothetical protein